MEKNSYSVSQSPSRLASPPRRSLAPSLIWGLLLLAVAAIILLRPAYLRGTDEYWYVADAASVAHGFHLGTNNFYPNSFTGHWDAPQRPFVHNRPVIYLVGFVDMIVHQTVFSWKLVNLILLLLTVIFVKKGTDYLLQKKYGKTLAAYYGMIAGIIYLFMPFNTWLVFQPMSTLTDGFFSAFVFLFIFPRWIAAQGKKQVLWWILLLAASVLFVYGRKDHLLMLILALVAWLWARKQLWGKYLLFIPALIASVWLCSPLFPGHLLVKLPPYRLILESREGYSNMVSFLDTHIGDYSFGQLITILIPKALHNLKTQFLPAVKLMPFYYIFDFLILLIIVGIRRGKKKTANRLNAYCYLVTGMMLSFFVIVLVYQNHYRYMVSVLPVATVVGFSVCLRIYHQYKNYQKLLRAGLIAVISSLFILSAAITVVGMRSDKREHLEGVLLGKKLNKYVSRNEPLVSEWNGHAQVIGYMHRPGPCLYVNDEYIRENPEILNDPKVQWIVTSKGSQLQEDIKNRVAETYILGEGFVLNKLKKQ